MFNSVAKVVVITMPAIAPTHLFAVRGVNFTLFNHSWVSAIILLTIIKTADTITATTAMVNGNGQSDIPIYCNHHGRKNKKGKE